MILVGPGPKQERFSSTTAVRPGIFNVEIVPQTPGERELRFEIDVEGVTEAIPGGRVRVALTPIDAYLLGEGIVGLNLDTGADSDVL